MLSIFVALYRLTKGKVMGNVQGREVLLLTTTGRKTGKKRTTPLGFFMEGSNYIITASNAGFDSNPGWFHNLRMNPHVTIEVKDRQIEAEAEIAKPGKRALLWSQLISRAPGYANYTMKTTCEIPLVVLHPLKNV
jgi:deazaflavin-dependent oxidoreductase (nitroreductase family)